MSQMFMVMTVEFVDDGLPVFAERRMAAFEPLAVRKLDPKVAIAKCLDALGKTSEVRSRMEHVVELWEKYLVIEEIRKRSDLEYDMVFVTGGSGQEFAVDFANMFATCPGVARVSVTIWSHDYFRDDKDGSEYGVKLETKPKEIWQRFPVKAE